MNISSNVKGQNNFRIDVKKCFSTVSIGPLAKSLERYDIKQFKDYIVALNKLSEI